MTDATISPAKAFSRWQASGLHLLISAAIAAIAVAIMLGVWYPPPLFTAEGGSGLLIILVAVDIVIGPLITLIIFKAGKRGLRFDLAVIGIVQVSALVYGCYVMFVARPVFIAFVVDQFETVRAIELDDADLAKARHPEFRSLSITGPVLMAVEPPADENERMQRTFETLGGGKDLRHHPQYYVPYAGYKAQVVKKSQPLESARKQDKEMAGMMEKYLAGSGRKASELRYAPLRTRRGFGVVLIDAATGDVVKLLPPNL